MSKRQEAVSQDEIRHGLWSEEEHERFLRARQICPANEWTQIARYVRTRSPRQVRSHAQKIQAKTIRHNRGLRKIRRRVIRREHRLDGVSHQTPVNISGINENATSRSSSEPAPLVPPALPASQIETTLVFDHVADAMALHDYEEYAQLCEFLKDVECEGLLEDGPDSC